MVPMATAIIISFLVSFGLSALIYIHVAERVAIVGNFIGITPSVNEGIAFGMKLGPYQQYWIVAALIIVAFIAIRTAKTFWEQVGFGLVLGGGLSNILDRFVDGHVYDMIQIGTFPIFNIADISINAGIILLFIDGILHWWKTEKT